MHEINIVMVEPEIPQNTGNVARTCAATGGECPKQRVKRNQREKKVS